MDKNTKVVFRKDLNKVIGIPENIMVENEAGFGGFTHKDNCTKRNNITVKLVRISHGLPIEKRTPCCNHLSGKTLDVYFDLVD